MGLTDLFPGSPHARVLDFLVERPDFDHNISEMAREAGIARPTVYKVVEDLQNQGVLVETRKVGHSQFYGLVTDHPIIQALVELEPLIPAAEEPPAAGRKLGQRAKGGSRS